MESDLVFETRLNPLLALHRSRLERVAHLMIVLTLCSLFISLYSVQEYNSLILLKNSTIEAKVRMNMDRTYTETLRFNIRDVVIF